MEDILNTTNLIYIIITIVVISGIVIGYKYFKEEQKKNKLLVRTLKVEHANTNNTQSLEAIQRSIDIEEYQKNLKIKEANMRSMEFANYQAEASANHASNQIVIAASTDYYNSQQAWLSTNYGKFQNMLMQNKNKLIGFYTAEKYNEIDYTIPNIVNSSESASTFNVFKSFSVSSLGATPSLPVLSGTTSSIVTFPIKLPENFTIFTLIRSNDSRLLHIQEDHNIFIGKGINRIEDENPIETNQWLIVGYRSDTPMKNKISKSFMINKQERGLLRTIDFKDKKLSINIFPYSSMYNSFKISFDFSTLLIFDKLLTDEEMDITYNALYEYLTTNNIIFSNLVL
jgi:hypothetical protein